MQESESSYERITLERYEEGCDIVAPPGNQAANREHQQQPKIRPGRRMEIRGNARASKGG